MKKKMLSQVIKNIAVVAASLPFAVASFANWTIDGSQLLDSNGNAFVFRGVTIDHTAAPEKTIQAIKDVAALGANSAQIEFAIKPVWVSGEFPRKIILEIRDIIQACKDNKLVCVLEANDVAGYSQAAGSLNPTNTASFWGLGFNEILQGAQSHIIIGFSNQTFDSHYTVYDYDVRMRTYLQQLSDSLPYGFMILIDGNKWAQDTDKAMLQFAQKNKAEGGSLSQRLIYSVDMFDAYTDPLTARDYIASFAEAGAPLVIGGFGPTPYYHPHNLAPRPTVPVMLPAQSIMHYAEEFGTGYFAWSWSGNRNGGLDLVTDWNSSALTQWGDLAINGVDGIKATAKPASIYMSSSSSSSSSSVIANQNPVAVLQGDVKQASCGYVGAELSAANSFDPDGDALTYEWEVYNPFSSSSSYYSGPTLSYGMRPVTNYRFTLTVRDGKGGVALATKTLSHSYSDYCIGSSSSIVRSSSSSIRSSNPTVSSSSIRSSSVSSSSWSSSSSIRSSSSSARSSSSAIATASCSYIIQSQWNNGFTAAIRIRNNGTQPIHGWNVGWQQGGGSNVTNLWNASLTGSNPYSAKNLSWNSTIQPGQTIEFGFQGSKSSGPLVVPPVIGDLCK